MANLVFSQDCYPPGDTNWDGTLNILDIIVTVNSAFCSGFNECSDGKELGYVPQEKNELLSNLMDAGKLLFGKLNEKTWVDNWLKLDVQVYLRDL